MWDARFEPDVICYNARISVCEKGEQWQRALSLFSEMWQARLEPDVISYSASIRACEAGGQWAKALDLLESMLGARVDPAAADSPDDGLYVHGFQAGGPKDVLKHIVLVALVQQMAAAADPFTFVDMHAGAGVYDLNSEESLRCRMFEEGVLRLSRAADRCSGGLIADYLGAVRRCNRALGASPGALSLYPGSPALAWQWLRPEDTAVLFEVAAEPYGALQRSFALLGRGAGRRLALLHDDSYARWRICGLLSGPRRGPAGGSWCSWTRHTIPCSPTVRGTSSSSGACSRGHPPAAWPCGTRCWRARIRGEGREPARQGPEPRCWPRARCGDVVRGRALARGGPAGVRDAGREPAPRRPR
ncbi:unnamed protein product [Prorocentrum cordatum]|uniref:Type II protein arginine methyltransferase n=1 Tax=Prorocentrum cordatum TaxID=2364126 RepID=A0ABN9SGG3_9DINO|nr:unnamed protein product [Polarella glacialis]